MTRPATSKILIFEQVYVAEEIGFCLALSENPKDRFCCNKAQIIHNSVVVVV